MACEGSPEVLAALEAIRQELAVANGRSAYDFDPSELSEDRQLGQRVTLPVAPTGALLLIDLVWAQFPKARPATIVMQLTSGTAAEFVVNVSLGQGATFRRQMTVGQGPARTLRVIGRRITVSASQIPAGSSLGTSTTPCIAQAAIVPFDLNPLGEVFGQWSPAAGIVASQLITGTPGTLLGFQGSLVTLGSGDTVEYIEFFDTNVGPPTGLTPLVSVGPLVANTPLGFDRTLTKDITFKSGLLWAISKTPVTFTAPGAGATANIDVDWGA